MGDAIDCFTNKTFGDIHNVKHLEVLFLFDLSSNVQA